MYTAALWDPSNKNLGVLGREGGGTVVRQGPEGAFLPRCSRSPRWGCRNSSHHREVGPAPVQVGSQVSLPSVTPLRLSGDTCRGILPSLPAHFPELVSRKAGGHSLLPCCLALRPDQGH